MSPKESLKSNQIAEVYAEKVGAVNQLTLYALALASRTKLAVKDFKCAWFDEKSYCEFFPLHAVYRKV